MPHRTALFPLYTFHCFNGGGGPVTFEAAELGSDTAAEAYAQRILDEHGSADRVLVCEDEREVLTERRRTAC